MVELKARPANLWESLVIFWTLARAEKPRHWRELWRFARGSMKYFVK